MLSPRIGLAALLVFGGLVADVSLAQAPAWWAARGVTNGQPADDYAVANIGQLKQVATQAAAEMNQKLPGGAGSTITALVDSWQQPPLSGVTRDDYAALNQGQLKAVAKLFYDRLAQFSYQGAPIGSGGGYPWTAATGDDDSYALANLGQLKYVFSFVVPTISNPGDADSDGMPDAWETAHGLNPAVNDAAGDLDGDGVSNLAEYQQGLNPQWPDAPAVGLVVFSPSF